MNTSFTTSAGSPQAAARTPRDGDRAERQQHAGDRQRGEDFERLLRQKAARHEEDDTPADQAGPAEAPVMPAFVAWAALLPPPKRQEGEGAAAGAAAGGAGDADARPATRAAPDAEPDAPQPLAPAPNAAGTWELTLRQPLAAAMDVRATRSAEAANGWSLSIASPTLDASVLARHAPRLNERLKARALSNEHVRIEERDEEDPR